MQNLNYDELVRKHISLMDENLKLMDKAMKLDNKCFGIKYNIRQLQLQLIDEFNKTLENANVHEYSTMMHYRNGLRFTMDRLEKLLKEIDNENN